MRGLLLGADLVDVREIEESLVSFGDRYLARVYTPGEVAYAKAAPSETARRLGARFAAKEATIKALGAVDVGIDLRSIEVTKRPDGGCDLRLSGGAFEAAQRAGVGSLTVSLSHQGSLAFAVVLAEPRHLPQSRLFASPRTKARRP
jgi:holo-[acyl-carrier protein] synthase